MRHSGKNQEANPRHKRRNARPVGELAAKLIDPVIERRAGMSMDILASWEEIVGEQHAAHTRPQRLDWPRSRDDETPFEPATLIVACAGPQAVFVQADGDTIISRVNAYFGFNAVSRLKIVQRPTKSAQKAELRPETPLPTHKQERLSDLVSSIDNPALRDALTRLGQGVFTTGSTTKR
ncbi:MAG: DciA family protein [Ahrensia sp.]|nr:DciA family protein [Ahrensia sp.]